MNVSEMNPGGNKDSKTAIDIIEANHGEIPERNLVFVTTEGKAKRVSAALFDTSRKTAQAMKASIVYVGYEGEYVVAETENGYSIKVKIEDLPVQGKGAGGVQLISLRRGDSVTAAVSGGNETEFGGMLLSDMKAVKRGGKGNKKGK